MLSAFVWKKNSEVNELIKWKRNITVQRDLILSKILWTPEKYRINLQVDYDYNLAKIKYEEDLMKENQDSPILVWSDGKDIPTSWDQGDNILNKALPENVSQTEVQWTTEQNNNKPEISDDQSSEQNNLEQVKMKSLYKIWRDF